jgi:hypothetical protein
MCNQQRLTVIFANYEALMPRSITIVCQNADHDASGAELSPVAAHGPLLWRSIATIRRGLDGCGPGPEEAADHRQQQRAARADPCAPQAMQLRKCERVV